MIVHDLDIVGRSIYPSETDTPLMTHTNAVLPFAISLEQFESITRRHSQCAQITGTMDHLELAPSHPFDIVKTVNGELLKSISVSEQANE